MTVKISNTFSDSKLVNAGAPQGSVLGTYVFNVATDDFEDDFNVHNQYELAPGDLSFLETEAVDHRAHSTPEKQTTLPHMNSSPIPQQEQDFVFLPQARNIPAKLKKHIEPTWRDKPMTVRKFVDDNLQIEKKNMMACLTYRQGNTVF